MIEEEEKLTDLSGDPNRHIDNDFPDKGEGEPEPTDEQEQPDSSEPQIQKQTSRIGIREMFLINARDRNVKTINDQDLGELCELEQELMD